MDFSPYFCNSGVSFPDFGNDSNLLGMSLEEMIDHDINSDLNDINAGNFSSLDLLNFKFDDRLPPNNSKANLHTHTARRQLFKLTSNIFVSVG